MGQAVRTEKGDQVKGNSNPMCHVANEIKVVLFCSKKFWILWLQFGKLQA